MKLLLNGRRLLKRKLLDTENDVRQSLKCYVAGQLQRSSFVRCWRSERRGKVSVLQVRENRCLFTVQRIRALVAHDP